MKKLERNFKLLTLVFLTICSISCIDDDDNGNILDNNNSAYDFTVDNPNLTILNAALLKTGLDVTLDQNGSTLTVFAPNDNAFQAFLTANNFTTIDDIPVSLLRNILRNHTLGTTTLSTDFINGYIKTGATTEGGEFIDLYVDTTSSILFNGSTEITTADITVGNGIVHIVNEVIDLPTVATLTTANPDFSNLTTAISQEGLNPILDLTTTDYTVFTPLDSSFQALIDLDPTDGISSIQDILALPNLLDILNYHIIDGAVIRAGDIIDGVVVDPIGPGTFTINTTNGTVITDTTGTETTILTTDITAINGVIHTINFVLRP